MWDASITSSQGEKWDASQFNGWTVIIINNFFKEEPRLYYSPEARFLTII